MALNQYISLKVSGRPDASSGYNSLILFNNPAFDIEDQDYVGFDNNSFFYSIKDFEKFTVYKLVKNNIRSYNGIRLSTIKIAFSIPEGYCLDNNITPYDVLNKLKDVFLSRCLKCVDTVKDTYEYISNRIEVNVLDDVVKTYTISQKSTSFRKMNSNSPIGYIVKPDEKIEEFFHDYNYPEFVNYSEIIIAERVNQTDYVPVTIQIPRLKSYEIWVDDKCLRSCTDPTETIKVSSHMSSSYYNNKTVYFTIQNLIDGDYYQGFKLDVNSERVNIDTTEWATPIKKTIKLKVPDEFKNDFVANYNLLKIELSNSKIKLDKNLSFTLEGEQIAEFKEENIKVELEQIGKYILSNVEISGDELRVTVEEKKRQVVQNTQGGAGQHKYQRAEKGTGLQVVKSSPVCDVSIQLSDNGKFADGNIILVKLIDPQTRDIIGSWHTFFKQIQIQNDKFEGHFYVPKELPNVYLYFQINEKKYITKQPLFLGNEKVVVNERDFDISDVEPFYKKKSFLIKLLIPFMAILLGFFIGFVSHDGIKSLFGGTKPSPVSPDSCYVEKSISMTENQAFDFLKAADDVLKGKDLEFSKVNELYKRYMEFKNVIEVVDKEQFNNKVCDRIEDYNKVVVYLTNGDVDKLREALSAYDRNDFHIWPQHAELLKEILKDDSTIEQFRNNYSKIFGFAMICEVISTETVDDSVTRFICDKCGQSFDTETELNSHRPSHDVTFKCDKCEQSFSSKAGLNRHNRKVHPSQQRFTCDICGRDIWFKTKQELENHKYVYHTER